MLVCECHQNENKCITQLFCLYYGTTCVNHNILGHHLEEGKITDNVLMDCSAPHRDRNCAVQHECKHNYPKPRGFNFSFQFFSLLCNCHHTVYPVGDYNQQYFKPWSHSWYKLMLHFIHGKDSFVLTQQTVQLCSCDDWSSSIEGFTVLWSANTAPQLSLSLSSPCSQELSLEQHSHTEPLGNTKPGVWCWMAFLFQSTEERLFPFITDWLTVSHSDRISCCSKEWTLLKLVWFPFQFSCLLFIVYSIFDFNNLE